MESRQVSNKSKVTPPSRARMRGALSSPMGRPRRTLASASNPRLWPSTVSIPCDLANRRFPSITKATCWGIGPWRSAPTSSSLRLVMANSIGGEARNHLRRRDRCIEPAMLRGSRRSSGEGNSKRNERRGEKGQEVRERGRRSQGGMGRFSCTRLFATGDVVRYSTDLQAHFLDSSAENKNIQHEEPMMQWTICHGNNVKGKKKKRGDARLHCSAYATTPCLF